MDYITARCAHGRIGDWDRVFIHSPSCRSEASMTPQLKPLNEQVIVITGASSGIGLVTARMAAKQGATIVAAARNEAALRNLVHEIRKQGGRAAYVVCDVGREEDIARVVACAEQEFGGFDT